MIRVNLVARLVIQIWVRLNLSYTVNYTVYLRFQEKLMQLCWLIRYENIVRLKLRSNSNIYLQNLDMITFFVDTIN